MGICWNIGILLPLRGYEGDMIGLYDGCNRWIQTSHHPSVGKPEASQKNLEVFGGFISRWYRSLQEAMVLPSHCWLLLPFPVYFRVGDPTLILLAKAKAKWEVMFFFFYDETWSLRHIMSYHVISCHINKILSCRHRYQGGLWELIYDIMVIWIYIFIHIYTHTV